MTLLATTTLAAALEKSQTLDELRAAVASVMNKNHIPGVAVAVVSKDRISWAGGLGKASLATGKDADADTMFRIASITKCFLALSIMKPKEQGKISLDAKVCGRRERRNAARSNP